MKRYSSLWKGIITFENLLQAAKQAQKSKRFQNQVLRFNAQLEVELLLMQQELQNKTYELGDYFEFYIIEPKRRMISAAPYRDRVLHHAVCNVIQPLLERSFIHHSYANRQGFGSHRALQHFTQLARRYRYILQCDIQKYFPNIDHKILKDQLRRKIKCPDTLWLIDKIIDHSNPQPAPILYFPDDDLLTPVERRRGLPVGNLTSQFFANFYLNDFDHFVQEQLKLPYVRYVDDFALFSNDKNELAQARVAIENYLAQLRLKIHPIKSQLFTTKIGASFLGFRVLPDRIRIKNASLRRSKRHFKHLQQVYQQGELTLADIQMSIRSWIAHVEHGNTWRLREQYLSQLSFVSQSAVGRQFQTLRGCGWNNNSNNCRVAFRNNNTPSNRNNNNGFRLVAEVSPSTLTDQNRENGSCVGVCVKSPDLRQ